MGRTKQSRIKDEPMGPLKPCRLVMRVSINLLREQHGNFFEDRPDVVKERFGRKKTIGTPFHLFAEVHLVILLELKLLQGCSLMKSRCTVSEMKEYIRDRQV